MSDACRSGGTTRWLLSDGIVEGRVVEENGEPATAILIEVRPLTGGERIRLLSNAEGEFRIPNLAPGPHEVRFARVGAVPWNARVVLVEDGGEDPVIRLCAATLHLHAARSRR